MSLTTAISSQLQHLASHDLDLDERRGTQLQVVSSLGTALHDLQRKNPRAFDLLVAYRDGECIGQQRKAVIDEAARQNIHADTAFTMIGHAFQGFGLDKVPSAMHRDLVWKALNAIVPPREPVNGHAPAPTKSAKQPKQELVSEACIIDAGKHRYAALDFKLHQFADDLSAGVGELQLMKLHRCSREGLALRRNELFTGLGIPSDLYLADKLRLARAIVASVREAAEQERAAARPATPAVRQEGAAVPARAPAATVPTQVVRAPEKAPRRGDPDYHTYREVTEAVVRARAASAYPLFCRRLKPAQRELVRLYAAGQDDAAIARMRGLQLSSVASMRSQLATALKLGSVAYPADRLAIYKELAALEHDFPKRDCDVDGTAPDAPARADPVPDADGKPLRSKKTNGSAHSSVANAHEVSPATREPAEVTPAREEPSRNQDAEITRVMVIVKEGNRAEFDLSEYVQQGWRFHRTLPVTMHDGTPVVSISLVR